MATPTPVKIDGYGTTLVSHHPDEDGTNHGLVIATFGSMRRDRGPAGPDGVESTWRLDLYTGEALDLAAALIHHARMALL